MIGLLLSVVLVATAGGTAAAKTADQVVAEVQTFYKGIKQVSAKFEQEVVNPTFGRNSKSNGKVRIKKPGKMRWDYYGKKIDGKVNVTKKFISDGKHLWVVDHGNKQVIEKKLDQNLLPAAVTFLYGKGDLAKDFTAALDTSGTYGKEGDIVVELTPKVASTQYKKIYLVVATSNYRVKESVVIDGGGIVNHFRFYEPNFKKKIADKPFRIADDAYPEYTRVSN
jgi:outer membrane lipoprotein carrier protein